MQSEVNMPSPICLIENTLEGELMVRQEAINILSEITQPLVVVAIVGLYRTGKSYLMNKLAGKNKGFSLGSTIQSHTKGIWMWCVPHPKKSNHTLVLLDTEGLGDVEKGDSNNDNWIFSLAILLSSTFVYNSMGTIDQRALEQLHYVTELSKYIRVKTPKSNKSHKNVEDSADFMSFFPNFIWTVRDFTLDLEFNDKPITADQYLENALQLLKGSSPKVAQLNLPRECIRFFFPGRKCFVFDRPASKKNLKRLEELHEDDLEPDFVVQTQKFCQYVLNESRTKTIHSGHPVSGKLLANLAVTYVDAIRSGAVPCIENTVISLSHIENSAAVEEAVSHYQKQMKERGKFPTATIKVFLDLHAACEKEAIKIFMKRSFKDDDQQYQAQLGGLIKLKAEQFCAENEQASIDICKALLEQVFRHTQKKIAEGFYSRPGGYLLFMDAQKEVTEKCKRTPGRGLKADEVIQQFRQEQQSVAITILQMAQNLSKKEKEFAKEQARAKAAQQEMKLKEEMHAAAQLKLETQLKSHKEHTRQLTEKLEEDMQKMQEEHYRVMTQKLMEQDLLHQEGVDQQHKKMQAEIQRLQTQMDAAKQPKKRDNCVIL